MIDIDREKHYSIAEVSKITGYDKHVLRFYENEFNFQIPRTSSNRRYYTYKEIEKLLYLRELQNKGLTNKQIKLIFESPEIFIRPNAETALAAKENMPAAQESTTFYPNIVNELCQRINEAIHFSLHTQLAEAKSEIIHHFDEVMNKTEQEDGQVYRKEKDILICENARLKMKLKEKSYEVAELKEKIKRLNHQNQPFWKRIFSFKKDMAL
ncbi:MerR family transcriptional regulator [Thermotalea metallivorans]|uniref:HTH merR-type domain-containing protein n=1 Tax=Thermotalea metallivorans TaxID=520762 RepID=A0A140L8I3_9FIRM|nr:MerR family transcriptional regulator [Thermotalea metallivorans]KXG76858.1 hypothetical protein AN619_08500 [Thermotalea metallivorans]